MAAKAPAWNERANHFARAEAKDKYDLAAIP